MSEMQAFAKGRFTLPRLLQVVKNARESTIDQSVSLFCKQNDITLLNTDFAKFHVGGKKVIKVQRGAEICYLKCMQVYSAALVASCENSYNREADGLLYGNRALAELVVPSLLREVEPRFVPATHAFQFLFVQNAMYVFILMSDCGITLDEYVFNQKNWSDGIEFSRKMEGIVLQCLIALQTYQRSVNFCHADLHRANVTLKNVDEDRDFVVVLSSGANKTFHLDKDIPQIYFVDFEEATATAHLENTPPGTSSEHNTFTVFGTTNSMIHTQDNCYDIFRLLTTMANNSLGKTMSPPFVGINGSECVISAYLESLVGRACFPPNYHNNWHALMLSTTTNIANRDIPSHNANLMRYPLTPDGILSEANWDLWGHASLAPALRETYMQRVFLMRQTRVLQIEPISWSNYRQLNTEMFDALKKFTHKIVKHKVKAFENQHMGLLDTKTIRRATWRTCIVTQKAISLFYTYVDSLQNGAYSALTDVAKIMDILFALLFLLQRDECTPELQCSPESMQKIKNVYVSNKNRRVPIELVSLEDAMGTSQEAWCNIITEKSVERMVYMQPVTEALVRHFFFK
jgi:hypothetical protein